GACRPRQADDRHACFSQSLNSRRSSLQLPNACWSFLHRVDLSNQSSFSRSPTPFECAPHSLTSGLRTTSFCREYKVGGEPSTLEEGWRAINRSAPRLLGRMVKARFGP